MVLFLLLEHFNKKYSFANVLSEYELWVQNVSDEQPQITCNEQKVLMSEYQFETDKDPEAEQTLGDGGDMEEVRYYAIVNYHFVVCNFLCV